MPVRYTEGSVPRKQSHNKGKNNFVLIREIPGYIHFTDTVDFEKKQKVPRSYSRAEENARFANGVRDDETKKDYVNPEVALKLF